MTDERFQPVHIIGGGLAGSEAAWQIAARGIPVVLHEMRPLRITAAHKTAALAELVCSNSFRSDDREHNAVGLLHEEMRRLGSLVMRAADANQVPAGGALAVDREGFAAAVTAALAAHPLIDIRREEIAALPPRGLGQRHHRHRPPHLARAGRGHREAHGRGRARLLRCHRADRPPRVDRHVGGLVAVALRQGRPGRIGRRLRQLPARRASNTSAFVDALLAGDKVSFHEWEGTTPYFDGCLPIEVMAERGRETLAAWPDEAVRPDQSARARQ